MIINIKRIKYINKHISNYFAQYLYYRYDTYVNTKEHLYLIYDNDLIIGSFSIIIFKDATLQNFYIIPKYRGYKISIYTLDYIKNEILNNKMKYIFIDVLKSNCVAYNTYSKYYCFLQLYFFNENYGFMPDCNDTACRFILQR